MPLFLDRHEITADLTADEVAQLHVCDLDVAQQFGVQFVTYWFHSGGRTAFCLAEAPDQDAVVRLHKESHGFIPADVVEVDWGQVQSFLGRVREPARGEAWEDISMRVILCTEIDDPEAPSVTPGATALRVLRSHDRLAAKTFRDRGGVGIRRRSEGIVGCFVSVVAALQTAAAMLEASGPLFMPYHRSPVRIRIGISAGEPLFAGLGLFEAALDEASAICEAAQPGEVLLSEAARDLATKAGYVFAPRGTIQGHLPGESVRLYRLEAKGVSSVDSGNPSLVAGPVHELSRREVEVLRLVALGRTNQEIADQLIVSLHTVHTHVRNILEKTDSANRAEAASFAVRHRLA
jgi:DNA-binding CsgD family transcriptional regulator/class 3 adenylate cyclase